MEGTRAAGRRPFMPASRILEGSLPERHPKGPDLFWRPTTTQNGVRAGYQGRSPCLVRPPTRPELVGSHLRGDQFYGQVVSVAGSMAIVRSEIEPYRRPIARWFTRPHSVLWPEEGKVRAAPE